MSLCVLSTGKFQALLEVGAIIARKIAATLARRLRAFGTERPHCIVLDREPGALERSRLLSSAFRCGQGLRSEIGLDPLPDA
jgi:hypothetical protein